MITFGEWHKFNFVDNQIMDSLGDIYIKVFRKHSFTSGDKCLEGLMKIEDAVKMFGNYPLMKVNYHTASSSQYSCDYKALCALIYMPEDESDD